MKKVCLVCLILFLGIFVIERAIHFFVPVKNVNFKFDDVSTIKVILNGNPVNTKNKQDELLQFFENMNIYNLKTRKMENTAAYIYIYMYDKYDNLINGFWIYGDGKFVESVSNFRYCIKRTDLNKLVELLQS